MKPSFSVKSLLPDFLALLTFLFFTFLYFSPVLQGKVLSMHDIDMASGAAQELKEFHDKTGEWAWWTNSMFGGMPGFMIAGSYEYSLASKLGSLLYGFLPIPANIFLLLMVGFYVLTRVLNLNRWVGVAASLAYAFGTYNLLYMEAGHISKVLALAYAPGMFAGILLVFKRNYWVGAFITALFVSLELYANHLQITYYSFFIIVGIGLFQVVGIIKSKEWTHLTKSLVFLIGAGLIGVGMHSQRLWSNAVYSAETIRGKSELTQSDSGKSGLDKDYAFSWSYGINESFNLIIPNLMGGGSSGALDDQSETYKVLVANGVPAQGALQFIQNLPLYHGEQSVTSGPAYSGIVVFFFFILGLFLLKGNWKWGHLGLVIFMLILSWGSNLPSVNYWFFDHFPGYNKFRAVSMIMTLIHLLLVWGAALSVNELLTKEISWQEIKRPLLYTLGISVLAFLVGYMSVNFVGIRDQSFLESLKGSLGEAISNQLMNALREDRSSLALSDIFRGAVFLILSSAFVYLLVTKKLSLKIAGILLVILVCSDLIPVGKRYFNNDDFQSKFRANSNVFEPTAADNFILEDKDPNFRVINLASPQGFMSDARDSYFHKSLGGYHGAKLKRYNELVTNQMLKDGKLNMGILNMLNTKYFIINGQAGQEAQRNPGALGNAWFVDSLQVVANADEELLRTGQIDPSKTAVTQKQFAEASGVFNSDSSSTIQLKEYAPNRLVYSASAKGEQFAVFSEIYYRGNKDWKSYIDGNEVPHIKVDYVLRGMTIPDGNHEVVFEFKPESVSKGEKLDLAFSVGLILLFGGMIFSLVRKTK